MSNQAPLVLQDVILPTPMPLMGGWFIAVAGAALLMIIVMGGYIRKKSKVSPAEAAKKESLSVEYIHKQWQTDALSDRQAAFFLAKLLCTSMQIKQLPRVPPENFNVSKAQWGEFIAMMDALRYQNQAHVKLNPQFFDWVRVWLATEQP